MKLVIASIIQVLLSLSLSGVSYELQAQTFVTPLGEGPWITNSFEESELEVRVLVRGMDHPFGMVFLSPEQILISERTGNIRLYTQGDSTAPVVANLKSELPLQQLFDLELHPDFQRNGYIYFSWIKDGIHPDGTDKMWSSTALSRGIWDGKKLSQIEELFVAEAWSDNYCGSSSRLHFMTDQTVLLGVSHRCDLEAPQSLKTDIGKILRLNDDGSIPINNPFVGNSEALPEIYALGVRSAMDFVTHPQTGEIWELENGPQGGDEVNILDAGANYGWPLATYGRDYDGSLFNPKPWLEGSKSPELSWIPSITVAGMSFYTGSKFPHWKGNLFVTSMIQGRIPGTGHLERIVFNEFGEIRREELLNFLHQRIRFVLQGPDEFIYLLTDETDGALLRLAPPTPHLSKPN
jgi:glucose/arabinose dehydrogenase